MVLSFKTILTHCSLLRMQLNKSMKFNLLVLVLRLLKNFLKDV